MDYFILTSIILFKFRMIYVNSFIDYEADEEISNFLKEIFRFNESILCNCCVEEDEIIIFYFVTFDEYLDREEVCLLYEIILNLLKKILFFLFVCKINNY